MKRYEGEFGVVNTDNNYKFQVPIDENKVLFTKFKLLHGDRVIAFTDSQTKVDFIKCLNKINGTPIVFNLSNKKDLSFLFKGFKGDSLDLSHFDTSKVINMSCMFSGCTRLQFLDISHFDTSNVTYMDSMFSFCESLQSLDLSHFDTSNVTNMSNMFEECWSLRYLDLSHFNTSKVTNMTEMFSCCESLQSLELNNFDTSKVTSMGGMFRSCKSLQSLDLSHFNTSNVTYMDSMFSFCESLQSLDLSYFDTSKVTDMSDMFLSCTLPKGFSLGDKFNTKNVKSMQSMFEGCSIPEGFSLGDKFDTSNVENMDCMFSQCYIGSRLIPGLNKEEIINSLKKNTSNGKTSRKLSKQEISIKRIADSSNRLFPDVFPTEEDNITEKLVKEKSSLYLRYVPSGSPFYSGPYRELYNQNMLDESIEEYGLDEDDLQSYVKIDNINSISSNIDIDENKDIYLTVYKGYYIIFNNKYVKDVSHIFDHTCSDDLVKTELVVDAFINANLPESVPEVSEWSDIYDELFSELIDFVSHGRLAKGEKDAFKSLVLEVEKKVKSKGKKDLTDALKAVVKGISRVDKLFNIHGDEYGDEWTLPIDNFKELSQKESLYFESLLYCDDSEEHVCAGCLCYDSSKRELQIRYPIGY